MTLGAKHNQFSQSMLFDVLRGYSCIGRGIGQVRFPIVDYGPASRVFPVTVRDADYAARWTAEH
jgi:hypothetical protein